MLVLIAESKKRCLALGEGVDALFFIDLLGARLNIVQTGLLFHHGKNNTKNKLLLNMWDIKIMFI